MPSKNLCSNWGERNNKRQFGINAKLCVSDHKNYKKEPGFH